MTDEEKLYDTMGELLYAVAIADGVIQNDERTAISNILKDHKWADQISWSFEYEESKQKSLDDTYAKVISVCHRIGPNPIYTEFIEAMNLVAEASDGIDDNEAKTINSFSSDLIKRFTEDLENMEK